MDLHAAVRARRAAAPDTAGARRRTQWSRRRVALLGGTTSSGDCMAAAAFLLRPQRLVHGPALRQYESTFADYVGVRHGYSFATGRVALSGILAALEIGDGDDVIVQVPTHVVVANAVRYAGARPIFVDSSIGTCNMDLGALERGITSRTKAIVLQHTFGIPADVDAVLRIASEYGITIIEDCVHALGARYRGARLGSLGRVAFFSTEETKTISTTMGGMAVTNDDEVARRLRRFQQDCAPPSRWLTARYLAKLVVYHVLTEPHLHRCTRAVYEAFGNRNPLPGPTTQEEVRGIRPAGYERRLSNAQALLGLRQLRRIDQNLAHRELIAEAFRSRLQALGFDMPQPPPGASPAYVRFPVYVEDRSATLEAARRRAVLGAWFTSVLEEAVDPAVGGYVAGSCPAAEQLSQCLVNLPTHRRVSLRDVDAVVTALASSRSKHIRREP
jgi:perosamine synthetase